jgi:hypothetical protein
MKIVNWFASTLALAAATALAGPSAHHWAPVITRAGVLQTAVPRANAAAQGALSGGGTSTQPGPAAAAAPATFSGNTYGVDAAVTPTTTGPEAEEHIAVDPANANYLVAAISDFSSTRLGSGYNTTKYAWSSDNGDTWQEAFVPTYNNVPVDQGGFPVADGQSWDANSDPVVAIDNSGNVYIADLYFNVSDKANGYYVNVGQLDPTTGAFTYKETDPVAVNTDLNTQNFEDKPWIAVDNSTLGAYSHPGTVYASWTHFTQTTTGHGSHTQTSSSDEIMLASKAPGGS